MCREAVIQQGRVGQNHVLSTVVVDDSDTDHGVARYVGYSDSEVLIRLENSVIDDGHHATHTQTAGGKGHLDRLSSVVLTACVIAK